MLSTARRLCCHHATSRIPRASRCSKAAQWGSILEATLGSSQPRTCVPSRKFPVAAEASMLVREAKGVGFITLNRPKALNVLSLDMIRLEGKFSTVHLRGAGEKVFCAGGDIRAITAVPGREIKRQFFREEYQLDHLVYFGNDLHILSVSVTFSYPCCS